MSILTVAVLATLCSIVAADCGGDRYGSTSGYSVKLMDTIIPPGVQTVQVAIPADEACYPGLAIGTYLEVCDDDGGAPIVRLHSLYDGLVTRRSNLRHSAVVHTTVYCSDGHGLGQPGVHAKTLRPTITIKAAKQEAEERMG